MATTSSAAATTVDNTGILNGNATIDTIAQNAVSNAQGANDDAHKILTELFGSNWDNLFSGQASGGGVASALFDIFGYMNAVTLVGVSVMLFYVITVGIIGTAHEGEALGKRYSTLWTPIRSVSSIAMLMPLPGSGGISLLQALLLMCISVGSNSANYVWGKTLDFLNANGGNLVTTMPTAYATSTFDLASQILEAEVAQEYIAITAGGSGAAGQYATSNQDLSSAQGWLDMITTTPFTGDNRNIYYTFSSPIPELVNKFGKIAIQCDSDYVEMCEAEQTAVETMISTLKPVAVSIANREVGSIDPTVMNTAVATFNQTVFQAAKQAVSANNPKFQQQTEQFVDAAKTRGWIQAGSWYWTLAGMQERVQSAVERIPSMKERPAIKDIEAIGLGDISDVMGILDQYKYTTNADIRAAASAGYDGNVVTDFLRDTWGRMFMSMPKAVIESTTKGDPIANLKSFGSYAIDATVTVAVGVIAFDAASDLNPAAVTTKAAMGTLIKATSNTIKGEGTLKAMFGAIAFILIPLFIFFLYITYYLPAIPFILFATGVVSWFVLIMETVAVAPLWAAAHAIPEGEGFAGQHGKQGYMLFMGVLLRPSLMVCGFLMAMFMVKGVSWFVGQGLMIYFDSANASEVPGPITAIAMTILGLIIIIKLTHKCFDVILWMPDNALKWIGGSSASLGESGTEQHANNMFGVATGSLNKVGHGAGKGLPAGGQGKGEASLIAGVEKAAGVAGVVASTASHASHAHALEAGSSVQQSGDNSKKPSEDDLQEGVSKG